MRQRERMEGERTTNGAEIRNERNTGHNLDRQNSVVRIVTCSLAINLLKNISIARRYCTPNGGPLLVSRNIKLITGFPSLQRISYGVPNDQWSAIQPNDEPFMIIMRELLTPSTWQRQLRVDTAEPRYGTSPARIR